MLLWPLDYLSLQTQWPDAAGLVIPQVARGRTIGILYLISPNECPWFVVNFSLLWLASVSQTILLCSAELKRLLLSLRGFFQTKKQLIFAPSIGPLSALKWVEDATLLCFCVDGALDWVSVGVRNCPSLFSVSQVSATLHSRSLTKYYWWERVHKWIYLILNSKQNFHQSSLWCGCQ